MDCDLCSGEKRPADLAKRSPLSKRRNKHLQCMLLEVAKVAPRISFFLAII
jgi:transposase